MDLGMDDKVKLIYVRLIIRTDLPAKEVVQEMICEIFGKEERKDRPRAQLILIESEEK